VRTVTLETAILYFAYILYGLTMKRSKTLLLVAAGVALLSSCVEGKRYETTISRKWPARGITSIELREVDGGIQVGAGAADEISLVAHVRSRGVGPQPGKENGGFFVTRLEGDTLRLGREEKRSIVVSIPFLERRRLNVDYELHVPPTTHLTLRTVNGQITTIGVNGESNLTTVNGAINVDTEGDRQLNAKCVNGSVKATFRRDFQGAHLKTVNGSVEAILPPSASFACDLSQVNGDFEATFPLSIHSHPGSRQVSGEVNGGHYPLRITTVNGDIAVANGGLPPKPPLPPALGALPVPPAGQAVPAQPAVPTPPAPPAGMPSQKNNAGSRMVLSILID
jgi:hypothetical protein